MARARIKTLEAAATRSSTRFSSELIRQLVASGRTQTQIANMLAVTKSFISRVSAGQRALTIEHLSRLEQMLGKPIALFLLEAAPTPADSPELVREREKLRSLLQHSAQTGDDKPLPAAEQSEVDQLSRNLDMQLKMLARAASPRHSAPSQAKAPIVRRSQVVRLLQREAGLSLAAARRAYQAQAKFAASRGLALFGT